MKTNKFLLFGLTLLTMGLFLNSCTKDDTANSGIAIIERPKINRTIDYTVLVVAGETSSTVPETIAYKKSVKAVAGAQSAVVQVSVQGKVLSKTTDVGGQATFSNLTAGIAAVTVTLAGHTTANYVVDLYHIDSAMYDNESRRIASTKVVVFPTTGTGMITVSGLVKMQSDIRVQFPLWATYNYPYVEVSKGLEYAPAGTVITAVVDNNEFAKYITGGTLSNITYEGVTFTTTGNADGSYSISVPSTAMGLAINIMPNDVATNVLYSAVTHNTQNDSIIVTPGVFNNVLVDKPQRFIFSADTSSVTAYTNKNEIADIYYSDPLIIDPDYFGSSAYIP